MMKFFRRYTKHMLAVFMALLLVVWLLEGTLDGGSGRDDVVEIPWGEAFGEKVTNQTAGGVLRDTQILERLGVPWNAFWPGGGMLRPQPLTAREWYMLDADARRRGLYVPQEEVAQIRENMPAERIEAVRNGLKASLDEIDHAVQSFLRVQRMLANDVSAVGISEADVQHFVRETGEKARVKLVSLTRGQFVDETYQPTEEELKEQFEKYKDVEKSPGTSGFGYLLPEEVQIEYIAVHEPAVAQKQQVSDEEAYAYWKAHSSEFIKPSTQPATNPATREAPKPYANYTDARQAVRNRLLTEKAKKEAMQIATEIAKTLNAPWLEQPTTQPGGYREPPASAVDPQLYPRIVDEFRKRYGDVVSWERTQFHAAGDFNVLGTVANARALAGTRDSIGLVQAAFLVQGSSADRNLQPHYARYFHNLYETLAEPFVDYQGNAYIIRTIAVRPKRSPAGWEVVKEDLIRDIRLKQADKIAEEQARQLADRARQVGLTQAVHENADLLKRLGANPVQSPEPFPRQQPSAYGQLMPAMVPGIGSDVEFIETVFSMAPATTTQPSRVALHTSQRQQRWIVVELVDMVPVTEAEYKLDREQYRRFLLEGRQMAFLRSWLRPENIRQRVNWKPADPKDEEETGRVPVEAQFNF